MLSIIHSLLRFNYHRGAIKNGRLKLGDNVQYVVSSAISILCMHSLDSAHSKWVGCVDLYKFLLSTFFNYLAG